MLIHHIHVHQFSKKDRELLKDLQSTPSQAVTEQDYIPLQGDSATLVLLKLIAVCVTF